MYHESSRDDLDRRTRATQLSWYCLGSFDRKKQELYLLRFVENLLDHLRTHIERIEVFRRGRIVDDFVFDFVREPGEEIEDYDTKFNIVETLRGSGWTSESLD